MYCDRKYDARGRAETALARRVSPLISVVSEVSLFSLLLLSGRLFYFVSVNSFYFPKLKTQTVLVNCNE